MVRCGTRLLGVYRTMYENMEVKDLFPTPLWVIDLQPDVAARLNESLFVEIHALTADRH